MNKNKTIIQHTEYLRERSALSFLMLLVSADMIFIALHVICLFTPFLNNGMLLVTTDRGYPEVYQYVKEIWVVILLFCVYVKTEEVGYIAWNILFLYLLFDDSLRVHEQVGSILAHHLDFSPYFGLRLQDYGELAVTAISSALLLSLIGLSYLHGSNMFVKVTRDLIVLLLIIAFFGVFIDMVHSAIKLGWTVNKILGIIEDGGEMIGMSFVAWYVFLLNIYNGQLSFSLYNLVRGVLTRR